MTDMLLRTAFAVLAVAGLGLVLAALATVLASRLTGCGAYSLFGFTLIHSRERDGWLAPPGAVFALTPRPSDIPAKTVANGENTHEGA